MQLRDKLVGPYNRTCHQLREEAHVEAEVEDVTYRLDALAIHIHDIADSLKGIERDAYWQQDGVDAETVGARHLIANP